MRGLGWDLMSQGELDAALQVLALNVGTFPSSPDAHSMMAEAYNRNGEREKALESCRNALELDPDNEHAAGLVVQIACEAPPTTKPEDDG
jgi:Tfp pilus assembly protein PilF